MEIGFDFSLTFYVLVGINGLVIIEGLRGILLIVVKSVDEFLIKIILWVELINNIGIIQEK
jgi:hypothetical protein